MFAKTSTSNPLIRAQDSGNRTTSEAAIRLFEPQTVAESGPGGSNLTSYGLLNSPPVLYDQAGFGMSRANAYEFPLVNGM
jgi:hypothetical protein